MGSFAQQVAIAGQTPPRVVSFPPSGFADDYDLRPLGPVDIGIRRVSSDTLDTARSWAAKKASRRHSNLTSADKLWIDAFNEAFMQWVVAKATCQPHDVNTSFWTCAEDVVPIALAPRGLLRLWEEYELLCILDDALPIEASLDECELLGKLIVDGTLFDNATPQKSRYCRRLIARILEELGYPIGTQSPIEGVKL